MKKLFSLLLALSLLLTLTACGFVEMPEEQELIPLDTLTEEAPTSESGLPIQEADPTDKAEEPDPTELTTPIEDLLDVLEPVETTENTNDNSNSSDTTPTETKAEENTNQDTDWDTDELPPDFFLEEETEAPIDEDGSYTTKDEVALYIHTYGKLPKNFITKNEARKLGWEGGSLEPYAPGKCIGGDYFGNYEGLLPTDRKYTECDIDTLGAKSRGAKRIVFSNDGLIYYTDDHYESFTLLYGEE